MDIKRNARFAVFALFVVLPLMGACVGGQSGQESAKAVEPGTVTETSESGVEKLELASVEDMVVGAPLATKYDNVIIGKFEGSAQLSVDYPKAAEDCEKMMIEQLQSKKIYKNVTDDSGKKFPGKTAVVDLKIIDMRIASSMARMWGGALAGSSYMNVLLEVRNAGSNDVVHQKLLSTSNNAWGAAYSGGATDEHLPADFGVLVGEYLSKIIPAQ